MNTEIHHREDQPGANSAAVQDSLVNLHRSLDAIRPALASLPLPVSPEVMAGMQATENAWRAMEAEFGMLTGSQVGELLGSRASGRSSYPSGKRKAGKLIGVRRRNAVVYPGFQFDQDVGRIRDVIPGLIAVIRKHGRTEEDLAQWLCNPSGYLDGDRPVDHLGEPERVLGAAEGHYGVEW
ncbi:hypothetical protein SAMN04489742_3780 [Arthrobacter crystallopoietes]|uniref:Antitoxin Xre/MbcA/ParS-like toxin-binding domain-containing protein n=1 Tax=Crystallibacter crystallopoietes TaxID=37928 RepID=A0A1H1G1D5_9MICC|nr:hypothetical protein [Arthrobacter crystallopoietes]SDR07000.1 hypothetical protein SAMN04489742_3780 [Arthrobacter crystallopoietes]